MTTHDQRFKNLIVDYPRDALHFFAAAEAQHIDDTVRFIPIRQEQLQERFGERFRELDTPIWVEWPDGRREILLFVVEEETEPGRFSIHRLIHYCVDLSEMFKTTRVVPVVIFLHRGSYDTSFALTGDHGTYLDFRFLYCDLPSLQARDYLASTNLVARLNVMNMAYAPDEKLAVFNSATEGLASLETDREKQRKYRGFIDAYVQLSDDEYRRYREEYLARSPNREVIMGYSEFLLEEGRKEGRQEEGCMLVKRLLEKRFGPLPDAVQQRLQNATPEELEHWAMRMLEVDSLDAVFKA